MKLIIIIAILASLAMVSHQKFLESSDESSFKCTSEKCFISYIMDDTAMENWIAESATSMNINNRNVPAIVTLKFISCQIETIPTSVFFWFPSLLGIMFTSPGIAKIKEGTFKISQKLESLQLSGNRIENLVANGFLGAYSLKDIDLDSNDIVDVSEDAFVGLYSLKNLNLARNKITFFEQNTFKRLRDLENLDISGNKIEFLDVKLFGYNFHLSEINAADNKIVSISPTLLDRMLYLKVLKVMNNPCTKNTCLEGNQLNIEPLKSRETVNYDERSLKGCYVKYVGNYSKKAESKKLQEKEAETQKSNEKDVVNKETKRNTDLLKILITSILCVCIFFAIVKLLMQILSDKFKNDMRQKIRGMFDVVTVDYKPVVYTIEN